LILFDSRINYINVRKLYVVKFTVLSNDPEFLLVVARISKLVYLLVRN
jgi:hypothetical protein